MVEMIQETDNDDGGEIEADALIDLVDGPPARAAGTPPPPPVAAKSVPTEPKQASTSEPPAPSASAVPPLPAAVAEASRPPSAPPPSRLSSLPIAPPRPGVPSSNPITDRPSSPPRTSSVPRMAAVSSPLPSAPPQPVEKSPLTELQEQLDFARRAISVKEAEVRAVLGQRDKALLELESLRQQLAARDLDVKEREFASLTKDTRIRELEKELDTARAASGDSGDDLKLIRGIGPAFERELKRLGIRTFSQIAAWTPDDMQSIAKKIKAKPDRIRRDDWIARAAELAAARGPRS
jgi:NADH-quinone oxidoreductase subunit E